MVCPNVNLDDGTVHGHDIDHDAGSGRYIGGGEKAQEKKRGVNVTNLRLSLTTAVCSKPSLRVYGSLPQKSSKIAV